MAEADGRSLVCRRNVQAAAQFVQMNGKDAPIICHHNGSGYSVRTCAANVITSHSEDVETFSRIKKIKKVNLAVVPEDMSVMNTFPLCNITCQSLRAQKSAMEIKITNVHSLTACALVSIMREHGLLICAFLSRVENTFLVAPFSQLCLTNLTQDIFEVLQNPEAEVYELGDICRIFL